MQLPCHNHQAILPSDQPIYLAQEDGIATSPQALIAAAAAFPDTKNDSLYPNDEPLTAPPAEVNIPE
jgi:hypothetical protein